MTDAYPLEQWLTPEGQLAPERAGQLPETAWLVDAYKQMRFLRHFDQRAINLQRQGRIGTYAPFAGQEAAQVGAALALREGDWLVPTYRDHGLMTSFGFPLARIFLYWMGHPDGAVAPPNLNILPPAVPIATQIPHAAGLGWAARLRGQERAVLCCFGDGATSEGDFHEGLNFAAVFRANTVFFCQNNQYAISVPRSRQTAAATIAQKAVGYGMPGQRVDGNDVLAVYHVVSKALARARAGEGPTLIEAVTYRLGAHTTADDPTRYRSNEEAEAWQAYDPLIRLRTWLEDHGLWSADDEAALEADVATRVQDAVDEAMNWPKPNPELLFDTVYAAPPPALTAERQAFLQRQAAAGGDTHA